MDQGGPFAQRSGRFLVDMPVFLLNGRVQGRVGLAEQVEGAALRALADADDAQGAAGPGSGRDAACGEERPGLLLKGVLQAFGKRRP